MVTASMVGEGSERLGQFWVLDVDATCFIHRFPRDDRMWSTEYLETSVPSSQAPILLKKLAVARTSLDMTCHLEPDWDHGRSQCILVYRHNGRIIYEPHRWNAILESSNSGLSLLPQHCDKLCQ